MKASQSSTPPIPISGWWNDIGAGLSTNSPPCPNFTTTVLRRSPGWKASPFIYYTVERQIGDQSRHFSIIGYDVFGGLGGPQKIMPAGISSGPIMKWWPIPIGGAPGRQGALGSSYLYGGRSDQGAIDSDGEPLVYLSLPDAQEVLYQKDNEEVRNQRERPVAALPAKAIYPRGGKFFPGCSRIPISSMPFWYG